MSAVEPVVDQLRREPPWPDHRHPAGSWILDAPETVDAIWGEGDRVLWARGEALMIASAPGLGKTTIGQQLALSLAGVGPDQLLDLPVARHPGRIAYIAADRPAQANRSFRRMIDEADRAELEDRMTIWDAALPFDLAARPDLLVPFAEWLDVGVVLIDSLGSVAFDLASDEGGAGVARAIAEASRAGIETGILHHDRKRDAAARGAATLDDVYGSRWLTAGVGSVVGLEGRPGDVLVKLRHLKQPAGQIGPLAIRHDHGIGRTTVDRALDEGERDLAAEIAALLAERPWLTAEEIRAPQESGGVGASEGKVRAALEGDPRFERRTGQAAVELGRRKNATVWNLPRGSEGPEGVEGERGGGTSTPSAPSPFREGGEVEGHPAGSPPTTTATLPSGDQPPEPEHRPESMQGDRCPT